MTPTPVDVAVEARDEVERPVSMFQDMASPPLPVPAPYSVEPSCTNCEQLELPERLEVAGVPGPRERRSGGGIDRADTEVGRVGVARRPAVELVEEPTQDDPGTGWVDGDARTSGLSPGCQLAITAPRPCSVRRAARVTFAAYRRGLVNAPPTYRVAAGDPVSHAPPCSGEGVGEPCDERTV